MSKSRLPSGPVSLANLAPALLAVILGLFGCSKPPARPAAGPSRAGAAAPCEVYAGIPPIADFVERVGGRFVRVHTLIPPGQEPHSFEPTPQQMAKLGRARLYFAIGFPFERRLVGKIQSTYKGLEVVDISRGIPRRTLAAEPGDARETETGAKAARHTDPHVWLSPRNAMRMAARIRDALAAADPAHAAAFRKNCNTFQHELAQLDAEIAKALAPIKGREIFVFHPAFGYFTDAYGLKQRAVEVGGKAPTARRLARLIDDARRHGVRVIFVQPQFSTRTAKVIAAAIHGAVVPMDPLAHDYVKNLRRMAAAIRDALKNEEPLSKPGSRPRLRSSQ